MGNFSIAIVLVFRLLSTSYIDIIWHNVRCLSSIAAVIVKIIVHNINLANDIFATTLRKRTVDFGNYIVKRINTFHYFVNVVIFYTINWYRATWKWSHWNDLVKEIRYNGAGSLMRFWTLDCFIAIGLTSNRDWKTQKHFQWWHLWFKIRA